uniref:N-acetyltransferase domain-containing protein n=1 Tax=Rhizochromulina marina TaxID=1034831 RepID=A0A7S2WUW8_9STRA|mmetsp:Transcript_71/g.238  ORF Transcript_71/g.238 Transcript_71/m.238 type:complete len:372 (+) Transcript_71:170-1285(+)|eukprot:CAMPEP_0118975876 /NCGR_PEP_ID=MMETSP1173-20130426/17076_1 /TAXON_ID=1034831 /ORGANISM="Rhizochromulina marina cf, Strain CCMP1243" /LENGTH=371 /DNA_ID=CAMNT_0006925833 /DNA_START=112 /DNA_END=1227 /DNA_ORIENTATION=+
MRTNEAVVLVGNKTVLVPYERKHVPRYHEWMKDPVLQETTASEPLSLDEEYAMQESWRQDPDKLTFLVMDPDAPGAVDGAVEGMVGDVNLFLNDPDDRSVAEVEVMIAEQACRRKGMAAEAVRLILWYGASEIGIRRFYCKIGEDNTASRALFAKLGFDQCGYAACFREVELEWHVGTDYLSERPAELRRVIRRDSAFTGGLPAGSAPVPGPGTGVSPPPPPAGAADAAVPMEPVRTVLPRASIRQWCGRLGDGVTFTEYEAQALVTRDCCTVNIVPRETGPRGPELGPLCVAMSTRFDPSPLCSMLVGDGDSTMSSSVARFVAKKSGRQCFATCSLHDQAQDFAPQLMAQIAECLLPHLAASGGTAPHGK